jgi:hemolysin activation/secretion protein
MAPFSLADAQRYLLLANDVPGVEVQAGLRPSAAGRGAVDLEVTVSRDPYDAVVNVQNLGSKAIGRWGGLLRADFNGFTPLGERSSLVLYSTLENNEQHIVQLLEEARFGDDGWLGRGSIAYARTRPGDVLSPLGLESDSWVASLEAVYPLIRKRRQSINLSAGLDYVDQQTDFGGGGTLTDDKLRVVFARAEAIGRGALADLPVDGTVGLEVRQGLDILGASSPGETTLSRLEGDPQGTVVRADGFGNLLLPHGFGVGAAFQAQWADGPLLSYEQLTVGNLTIGRGYDPSSVAGDRGVAGSLELRYGPWTPPGQRWSVQGYGFFDAARVEDLSRFGENRTVRSVGAGLRFSTRIRERSVSLDVAYADPLDKTSSVADSEPPSRLLVTLTAQLF